MILTFPTEKNTVIIQGDPYKIITGNSNFMLECNVIQLFVVILYGPPCKTDYKMIIRRAQKQT